MAVPLGATTIPWCLNVYGESCDRVRLLLLAPCVARHSIGSFNSAKHNGREFNVRSSSADVMNPAKASRCLRIHRNNFWRHTLSSALLNCDFFALPSIRLQKFRLSYVFLQLFECQYHVSPGVQPSHYELPISSVRSCWYESGRARCSKLGTIATVPYATGCPLLSTVLPSIVEPLALTVTSK